MLYSKPLAEEPLAEAWFLHHFIIFLTSFLVHFSVVLCLIVEFPLNKSQINLDHYK